MATSTIKRSGVRKTDGAIDAYLGAFKNANNPSQNQLIQIGVKSEMGNYLLMVRDSGISLYDIDSSETVHTINWTS